MSSHPSRTILFGLDGFDFSFARRLAGQGYLPWLNELFQKGSFVASHGSVLQGSEWVNAACGVSAAHHGFIHTNQLRSGSYEVFDTDAGVIRTEPFYAPLARSGVNTAIIDLPGDRPRPAENLTQIIDWGTEFKLWRYDATPAGMRGFIDRTYGPHPLTHYGGTRTDDATLRRLRDKLAHGTALKAQVIRDFLARNERWEFVFAGFGEIHKGGHFFWKFQDPSHPDYPGPDHDMAAALAELYRQLDRELADICALAGDNVNVMVVSDRGMEANLRGNHLVIPLLERWALYTPAKGKHDIGPGPAASKMEASLEESDGRRSLARSLKQRLPLGLLPLIRRLTGREKVDWSATRIFPLPNVGTSYLCVNLKGREPCGIVEPGEDYGELLAFLEHELKSLVNPATGRSPVAEVVFPQREFPGPLNAWLPDMGIVWNPETQVSALESPSIGRIEGAVREQRSGNHTSDGGILAAGPNFARGGFRPGDLRELAPTLLALYGAPIPALYERKPMPELRRSAE